MGKKTEPAILGVQEDQRGQPLVTPSRHPHNAPRLDKVSPAAAPLAAEHWALALGRSTQMPGPFEIRTDDLSGPEVAALLQEHLESVAQHSPPESVHALDFDALRAPEVTFWSVGKGSDLVGCGAFKELDASHGELKSMRTALSHLHKGVATALLKHMLSVARKRGYRRLSLETGSMEAFVPARALYARFGFELCGPFANYVDDPFSVFMTRELET